uniref:Pre-mRNA-splicing factor SYF1 n=1 Tax=Blastobotrys adeninivorans TaxID=409370 RepID=A0A060T2U4_BLAAD
MLEEDDVPYEQAILKNPNDLSPWLQYVEATQSRPLAFRAWVLERATAQMGRSYKLWKFYLDLRRQNIATISYYDHPEEFMAVNRLFEKAVVLLNKMPRIWIDYLEHLMRQPDVTAVRTTFDQALQSLPVSQHDRLWPMMLEFTQSANDKTAERIWHRYLEFDPLATEDYIELLIDRGFYQRASDQLIAILNSPHFISTKGRSSLQVLEELIELLVNHREIRGIDVEGAIKSAANRYPDQRGKLWVLLATYWIKRKQFDRARDVLEQGITSALTVRDFSEIFDSYVELEESIIAKLLEKEDPEHDTEVDRQMEAFEQLMDRRPFLVNDVLLRQDPNNVVEWEKRVGLWGDSIEQVVETYTKALETISPNHANGRLSQLWINYAKFYEQKCKDIATARIIFDKATKVPFKSVNELADIWIEWAEMELRADNFDRAIAVMEHATRGPKKSTIDFFDETKSPQERLHKSMKAWSFYLDLVESVGTLEQVQPLYERVFQLKIGTALTVINYASLLEQNEYFEESFKVFERGLEMFSYPIAFEIWNIYLNKAVQRQLGIERLRDLFEQALEQCPPNLSKPIYLMYGKLEEDRGLVRNAVKIYDRATKSVDGPSKLETYRYYISRVAENFGLPATRPIYQNAIDSLPDSDAKVVCDEFIDVEEKLGEVDRARALFGFASQFNDPQQAPFWTKWEEFEKKYGNEDTYKEMLRIKRSVQAQFETNLSYMASKMAKEAPMGFVTSTSQNTQQPPQQPDETTNPDQIDLDL